MDLTDLEKRLIVLSHLGITVNYADGHRWIYAIEGSGYDFNYELKKHGIMLNNKIYGSLSSALDIIDRCLELMGHKSLLESFFMDEYDILIPHRLDNTRIDIVGTNEGGLC